MENIFQSLRPFIRLVVRKAGIVLGIALVLSVLGVMFASRLTIDTDFSKLIPADSPSVQALERLRDEVGGESSVDVVIESPSFEANKAFAEALIPRALELRGARGESYLNRVDYHRDTDFLERNALYFATLEELDSLEIYLRNQIDEVSLEVNPFFFDIEDDFDDDFDDEFEDEEVDSRATIASLDEAYRTIVGKEYPISDDSTVMVIRFYPSGSQTNISFINDVYRDLETLTAQLNPASYHQDMEVVLAGRLLRQLVEVRAITDDVFGSFGAGVFAVLMVVVVYFSYKAYRARVGRRFDGGVLLSKMVRAPVMAALIGIPLLMSLSWTFGLAYLVFGSLNLMTSTLGLVLFGLGIDYGIHFYARYSEERARGHSLIDAVDITFASTGQAITIGAFTTAAALYVLMIADFRGFSEFGFIAGTGIIFALVAMTLVLPALLSAFETVRLLNFESSLDIEGAQLNREGRFPAARSLIFVSVAMVVAAIVFLPRVSFEYNFSSLEPSYDEYNELNQRTREVFEPSSRRNPAYIVVDSPEEVQAVRDALVERAADNGSTVGSIETLQDRFPMNDAARQTKLDRIADIREILASPFLQEEGSADLDRLSRAAETTEPLQLEDVPETLRNQFVSKSGQLGNFVMVYPSVGLSDGRNSIAFSDEVGTVVTADGQVYHAGSTSLVAADMLRLMMAEAPRMVLFTFIAVALLMYANFRSVRWAALALLPLVVGLLWMLLAIEFLGPKLNFYNLVVLPAILGIGNDAGVHLVHRYREEGHGSIMAVVRSTGEHVTIGSLTTMIGFAGLTLSFHPGLRSIGELAVIGVGATLLAAVLFLPALFQVREDRGIDDHALDGDEPSDVAEDSAEEYHELEFSRQD